MSQAPTEAEEGEEKTLGLSSQNAKRLAAGDLDGNGVSDLVIDFASVGVWVLKNGTTWASLHPLTTEGVTTGDLDGNGHDEVIIDFGGPRHGRLRVRRLRG